MRLTLHILVLLTAYLAGALVTVACLVLFVASVATVFLAPECLAVLHWTALLIGLPAASVPALVVFRLEHLLVRTMRERGGAT